MAIKNLRDRIEETKIDLRECSEVSCIEQVEALDKVLSDGYIYCDAGKAAEFRKMNWFNSEAIYARIHGKVGYLIPVNKL